MACAGKVLMIVQNLPVPLDRRVWLEATTLIEAGYQVSVIAPRGPGEPLYEVLEGVRLYRYPAPPEAHRTWEYLLEFLYCWLMTLVRSVQVFRQEGFDVIHACNPPDTFFLLGLLYRCFGKKFVFDHHDLSPEMYLAKGGKPGGLLHQCLLLLEKLTFHTADCVITTNQSHRKVAQSRGGVDPQDIFIVRSGPDFKRLHPQPAEPALKNGRPYLACYLGEMCQQDGVDLLLHSIKILVEKLGRRDTHFVFIGGGPEQPSLRRLSEKLKLCDYVEFTGRVPDETLCRYLSTADVGLDPTPWSVWADQSTMNKIMEYMVFGLPIVAFDLTEHRFSAGAAAIYALPNDEEDFARKIDSLLKDPDRRQAMGRFGRQRLEEALSWEHSKPHLLRAYAKLMGGGQD